jgi:hypothetical protein
VPSGAICELIKTARVASSLKVPVSRVGSCLETDVTPDRSGRWPIQAPPFELALVSVNPDPTRHRYYDNVDKHSSDYKSVLVSGTSCAQQVDRGHNLYCYDEKTKMTVHVQVVGDADVSAMTLALASAALPVVLPGA